MNIIVFGGGGFIGKRLVLQLLVEGKIETSNGTNTINRVIVFDKSLSAFPNDERLELIEGDICFTKDIDHAISKDIDIIFHVAAIVSGQAETDFSLGMDVNFNATRLILERCKVLESCPIFVFASTCGVFGGDLPDTVTDLTATIPQSSYGTAKAMSELLINDYSRRGWVDGRSLRLPTIVIRPGKPNAATSSFASGILREPLMGNNSVCPVDRSTQIWISSPKKAVDNFIHSVRLSKEAYGKNRIVSLPGITTSVEEMAQGLERVAGGSAVALIEWKPDPFIQRIFYTFPFSFDTAKANELGFKQDQGIADIIDLFIKEELNK